VKLQLECIPCFMKQAVEVMRRLGSDNGLAKDILKEIGLLVQNMDSFATPPEFGLVVHRLIKERLKNEDPYRDIKREHVQQALAIYPQLKRLVEGSGDPLYTSLKISAAGNAIDLAINKDVEISSILEKIRHADFALNDYPLFRNRLASCGSILLIGDNAGETVFDKVFLEQLDGKELYFAVREEPIINDATAAEAEESGIQHVASIISTGCAAPGAVLSMCSREFLSIFKSADIVISKGQGNFEALSEGDREVFYLLKAKCGVVAGHLKCGVGDSVFIARKPG